MSIRVASWHVVVALSSLLLSCGDSPRAALDAAGCASDAECDDGNPCTIDRCVAGACSKTAAPAGTVCRARSGPCDREETCDGTGNACPADGFQPVGTVCRAASGVCDAPEVCDGVSRDCPVDA